MTESQKLTVTNQTDHNEDMKEAALNILEGLSAVTAGAAREFAARTVEVIEDMREEAVEARQERQEERKDAREGRQSNRRLARIARLAEERKAVEALLEGADAAARAVLTQRLLALDTRVAETAGIPLEPAKALPAPKAPAEPIAEDEVEVRTHRRRKPGTLGTPATNGATEN